MVLKNAWVYDAKTKKGKRVLKEIPENNEPSGIELEKQKYSKLSTNIQKTDFIAKKLGLL